MEEINPPDIQQNHANRILKLLDELIAFDVKTFGSVEGTWATAMLYVIAAMFKNGDHSFDDYKEQIIKSFDHYKTYLWEDK